MMRIGTKVKWKWGSGRAEGTIKETFDHEVTKTLKGSDITRKGSADNKALLIEQADGDRVLKLMTEVERAE